jgi:benzil reductase ((S)-benzoin forming)
MTPISEHWYITGSSSGLGKAIAEKVLLRDGAMVFGFARKKTIQHPRYHHHYVDLSVVEDVQQIVFQPATAEIKLIALINNAGTLGEITTIGNLPADTITNSYHVNIVTPHLLMNQFLLVFSEVENANKCIINVSSGAANTPYQGWGVYCATKSALDMLTKVAAAEQQLLPQNKATRIMAIAPGVMDTGMQQQIRNADISNFPAKNKFVDLHKNQQLYDVQDVAAKYISIVLNDVPGQETIQRITL